MKRLLTFASLFALVAGPTFAGESSIEIKVPVNPASAAEVVEAHESILAAAERLCSRGHYSVVYIHERRAAERRCVEETYTAAVEAGREQNLAVFLDDAALENPVFE